MTTSLFMRYLQCTVAHYTNLNWSPKNNPFLNYRSMNMLFRFFRFLIYVYFNEAFVKIFIKALEKSWKYFLFHLHKLNTLLANQILHILCIFIKPNVWYSQSLKILAIKRCFPFNFAKSLQGHFVVGGPKNFKLLADICFENSLQNTVLSSLLLFLCACY